MTSGISQLNQLPLRFVAKETAPAQGEIPIRILTSRMREGDDEAWLQFHGRYYLSLLRYSASRSGSQDDAAEITQQVYLRVARHIQVFDDEAELWRWLACVARCAAVDYRRGARRRSVLLEKFAHWQEAQITAGSKDQGHMDSLAGEALASLPEEEARLLRLKYYDGWSVEQIASQTDSTPKAIENRLGRIRQRLRNIILRMQ